MAPWRTTLVRVRRPLRFWSTRWKPTGSTYTPTSPKIAPVNLQTRPRPLSGRGEGAGPGCFARVPQDDRHGRVVHRHHDAREDNERVQREHMQESAPTRHGSARNAHSERKRSKGGLARRHKTQAQTRPDAWAPLSLWSVVGVTYDGYGFAKKKSINWKRMM
jgi:hypothetical protein